MEILYAMRPLRLRHRCQLGLAVQRLSVFNHFDRNGGLSHPAVFFVAYRSRGLPQSPVARENALDFLGFYWGGLDR